MYLSERKIPIKKMKANEIQEEVVNNFALFYPQPREHYKQFLSQGQVFPTTKAQARAFIQKGAPLGLLGLADVNRIEALLNKHGFEGDYVYTKKNTGSG